MKNFSRVGSSRPHPTPPFPFPFLPFPSPLCFYSDTNEPQYEFYTIRVSRGEVREGLASPNEPEVRFSGNYFSQLAQGVPSVPCWL